eukprot:g5241.t1
MNSTARLPITTTKRGKKRNKKKDLMKRRMEEAEEKDRHKYSYASRHDSSKFIKGSQSFEILTNVQGSPRDPKAAKNAARDDSINSRTWKMGYQNAISTRPLSGKEIKVTKSGQIKLHNRLGKGWPFDTSLSRPDLVRGPEPWAPPLTNVYPKDWPSNDHSNYNRMPKNSHYPWSPPRRPSSAHEELLGSPKNIFSTGRRSSLMSTMKPVEFYERKQKNKRSNTGSGGFWNDENDSRYNERNTNGTQKPRRLIRSATVNGRLQNKPNKFSKFNSKKRPQTGPSPSSKRPLSGVNRPISGKSVQFNAESPARGRIRPQTAKSSALKGNKKNTSHSSGNRPQTALTPVQNRMEFKSRPKSAMPAVRPQTAILKNREKYGNTQINTGTVEIRRKEYARPHTVGPSPSRRRTAATMKRSKSAGILRQNNVAEPHHLRPTTATKTKRKYRVGLWPSGRWKYDYGKHITHHGKSRKGMNRKLKKNKDRIENGEDDSYSDEDSSSNYDSDTESVDENGETAKQRYKRRNNVVKRPMVAGQKKKKKLFESSSLATYTVMRSAPLKKHTLEEMLHAQEKETFKRVGIRNDACAWLLNHGRFKRMPIMRLWKKFSPIALENITTAGKRYNNISNSGGATGSNSPKSPKRKSAFGTAPNSPLNFNGQNNKMSNSVNDGNINFSTTDSITNGGVSSKDSNTESILQTVDNEPWRTEDLEHNNMWVTRPQFIYNMRVLMGLNETQKNLRELNKLYSSFDTKVQDMMNIREFCFVFVELREEKKRAVFGGMPDVSRFYDEAKSIFANPLY